MAATPRRALPGSILALLGVAASLALASCVARLAPPPARTSGEFSDGRELSDRSGLAELRAAADAEPEALLLQWKAGTAHLRATLRGDVDQREHAERYLERAWQLDPEAERVPAARVLARFLNMRSSVLDLSRLDLQLELYASLVEPGTATRAPRELEPEQFHLASFRQAAVAMRRYGEGRSLAALRELDALERRMRARTRAHPDEIDTHTMAGNFELTFAGVIPIGRAERLRLGIEHLEIQQDNWDQLSPRARNTELAPNVRSVFALFLAEALLAAGDSEAAAGRYRQLLGFEDAPETAVREQLRALARHRLANLDAYLGDPELLPPWPAGVSGCVACHSREAVLPTDDLLLMPGATLSPELDR